MSIAFLPLVRLQRAFPHLPPRSSMFLKDYLLYRIFRKQVETMTEPLPDLPEIQRLSPRVLRILGGNPSKFTLQGTNTYLIGSGRRRILLDTGEGKPSWKDALARALEQEQASVDKILLTHWHHDHIGGVADAIAAIQSVSSSSDPQIEIYKGRMSNDQYMQSCWKPISHADTFTTEGATLRAVHSPGHTADHMAFVLAEEDAMFTGDNVLGHGTAVFEDLAAYMSSLSQMQQEFDGRAYPGHGEVIADGSAKIAEYISHRKEREEQVVAVLKGRPPEEDGKEGWKSMSMVKIIYKDYPENLHQPAEGSLLQVLWKMEKDGRLRKCEDGSWRLTSKATL